MKTPRLFARALALAALTLSPLVAAPATHTINLTPAWKPGQAYTSAANASMHNRMVIRDGETVLQEQSQKRVIRFEADGEALASFPHGGLRKTALTVRSFKVSTDGAPETDFLPAGAKIVVESTGVDEETITIDGRPASPQQLEILKLVTATDDPEHNDQIMFGTDKPVAVGDTWKPNTQAIKATLGREFGAEAEVSGTMKLNGVEGSGPSQIRSISGSVTFDKFAPPLPPGLTAKSGEFRVKLDGRIPAARTGVREENLTVLASFVGEAAGPDGRVVTMTMNVEAKNASVTTFIDAAPAK